MRTIKFRAWVKEGGRYLGNKMYSWEDIIDTIQMEAGFKKSLLHFGTDKDYSDRTILMQFTGLYDKNGKEIYERDIVKYYDSTTMYLNGEVIFDEGAFGIKTPENPILFYGGVDCEIIGNIYENKNLL